MTAREPSAVEVVAEAQEAHGTYRLVGNPAKPSGWLCRCGVECKSPAERAEHRSATVLNALKAAGFVVATREQIRAMSPSEQAELIGGEVETYRWHPGSQGVFVSTPRVRVRGPWRKVQP